MFPSALESCDGALDVSGFLMVYVKRVSSLSDILVSKHESLLQCKSIGFFFLMHDISATTSADICSLVMLSFAARYIKADK